MLIVQKYGGTSVGSIDRMQKVAERCLATARQGHQVAVVVSAMSGETNRLLELTRQLHDDPNDREVDLIISTGEQVSVGLVALAIRKAGGKARSFLGHQCKIVTDSAFSRARIVSIDSTPIKDALADGEIAVIAGFQGVDEKGSITTLGRGGSDTTGVAIAAALNADGTLKWTRQFGGQDGKSTGAGLAIDPNGSSVLDALGLPRGTLNLDQSVELTAQTTLRAGASFQIKVLGNGARTATITIDAGETLDSLSTKINAQLGGLGKASVNYLGGAANLKLKVNPGTTIELVSGPKDFDALGRLGIPAGILTAPKTGAKAEDTDTTTFGLGFSGTLDISSRSGANLARSQLLSVLSSLQSTYQKTNAPPAMPIVGNNSGKASPYEAALVSKYTNALGLLGGS